jgi:hypothetical protein
MRARPFRRVLEAYGLELWRRSAGLPSWARALFFPHSGGAHEREADQRLERLLARHLSSNGAWPCEDESIARLTSTVSGPLPRQRRPWVANWWPIELLHFDFAPAWSRVAVLAGGASLGFMIGLTNPSLPGSRTAPVNVSEGDLSMIVFEPDPLSDMRP